MKKLVLLLAILALFISCANPHAENFTLYISETPQLVQAVLDCEYCPQNEKEPGMSDIEKEITLLEMFMGIGYSQEEACAALDALLAKTQTKGGK